jgi:branched-chain amino acid transport system permease protein
MSAPRLRTPRSLAVSVLAPLALIAAAWAVGEGAGPSLRSEVTLILCSLVIVCGLQLFIGGSGIYSFGHLAFAAIGAYLAAFLTLPPLFASLQTPALPGFVAHADAGPVAVIGIVAVVCALAGALLGVPLMRTSTLAIPISTFAFLIVVYNVLANWDALTGGSGGLVDIPTTTGLAGAALLAGLATLIALAFRFSPSGYRLQASREDEVAARALGVRVTRERLLAFTLSAALCGVGGALTVHESGVLTPSTFYFGVTVTTLTMLVLGGARSVFGAVCGTLAVGAVSEALRNLEEGANLFGLVRIGETPGLAAVGLGLILLVTIIALPDGITGGREAGELLPRRWRGRPPASSTPTPEVRRERRGGRVGGEVPGALEASGISVAFGGLQVLSSVDLRFARGEVLGLIGPNGAGKTTLVNALSGFQPPDSGTVTVDGAEITGLAPALRARAGLARSFQAALPFRHMTALESVAVGALALGRSRREATALAAEILDRLGLAAEAGRAAGTLAPGAQRLLGVGRALAGEPRYLLLDEPAAGLNDAECEELVAILGGVRADFGCGVLLIEHDMNVVMDLCPRVQVLEQGSTLAVGPAAEVQADPAVVEAYLGSEYLEAAGA